MLGNIAIIGDHASIIGFKAIGFKAISVAGSTEAEKAIDKLINDDCYVIFITEHIFQDILHVLDKYKDNRTLAIIPIPGRTGRTGIGMRNLNSYIEHALGGNILGAQDE